MEPKKGSDEEEEAKKKASFNRFNFVRSEFVPNQRKIHYSQDGDKAILLSKKLLKYVDRDLMKQLSNEYIPNTLTPDDFINSNPAFFDCLNYYFDDINDYSLLNSSSSFILNLIKANGSFIEYLTKNNLLFHQLMYIIKIHKTVILKSYEKKIANQEIKSEKEKENSSESEDDSSEDDYDLDDPMENSFFKIIEIMSFFCNDNAMVSTIYSSELLMILFELFDNFVKNQRVCKKHIRKTLQCLSTLITSNNKTILKLFLHEQFDSKNDTQNKIFEICIYNIFENEFKTMDNIKNCLSILNAVILLNPSDFLIESLDSYENLFSIVDLYSYNIDLALIILNFIQTLLMNSDVIPTIILKNNLIQFITNETMQAITNIEGIPEYFIYDSITSIFTIVNSMLHIFEIEDCEKKQNFIQELSKCINFIQMLNYSRTLKSKMVQESIRLFNTILENLDFSDGFSFIISSDIEKMVELINDSCDEDLFCSFINSILSLYEKGIALNGHDTKINEQIQYIQQIIFTDDVCENALSFSDSETYSAIIEHFNSLKEEYMND